MTWWLIGLAAWLVVGMALDASLAYEAKIYPSKPKTVRITILCYLIGPAVIVFWFLLWPVIRRLL